MSAIIEGIHARLCEWTLARAHARSGDPVAINADRNDLNHQQLAQAVADGWLEVAPEL